LLNISSSAIWIQNGTTIAGQANGASGPSTSYLNNPVGLTISNDDILYIADYLNNRVVVINLISSTVIRTIGSGPSNDINKFDNPADVFLVGTFLYVLDLQNNRIQKWSINGTNPSTLPGGGTFDYSYNFYIDKNENVYVSVYHDNTVIRFAANSGTFTTVAGTGTVGAESNRLNCPYGIFVDDNLTLYIADYNNHRIQKWTFGASSGTTVAGTGINGPSLSQISYPSSVVLDKNGYMYITDTGNNRIVRWEPSSTSGVCIVACMGTSGTRTNQLNWPSAVATDSSGSLIVADYDNNRVQKFLILNNQGKTSRSSSL
jgi:sugar lactone lactonase YvrE